VGSCVSLPLVFCVGFYYFVDHWFFGGVFFFGAFTFDHCLFFELWLLVAPLISLSFSYTISAGVE
jgi:hypothetical protein